MTQASQPPIPLPFQLSRMITSYWIPQSIHAAAVLGIADVLAGGAKQSAQIARDIGANPGALHRLLRALVTLELCAVTEDGGFALTPSVSACARTRATLCARGCSSSAASSTRRRGGASSSACGRVARCPSSTGATPGSSRATTRPPRTSSTSRWPS